MAQTTLIYNKIKFDSDEEVFVAMWLDELQQAGIVNSWTHDCIAFPLSGGLKVNFSNFVKLKTKTKEVRKTKILLRPSEYTPDFKVVFDEKAWGTFISAVSEFNDETHVLFNPDSIIFSNFYKVAFLEVKPSFDQNNMTRLFKNNQKFVWERYKIFINLIEPEELFKKTFMPKLAAPFFRYKKDYKDKKAGDWKTKYTPRSIKKFLEQ